jgi:hypothetical protein
MNYNIFHCVFAWFMLNAKTVLSYAVSMRSLRPYFSRL